MIGGLPGWPEGLTPWLPDAIASAGAGLGEVAARFGMDPIVMLLRSTAALALGTLGGRESTVTAGEVRVRMILEELTVGEDPQGVMGRLGEVRMVARDVVWAATRLRRVTLSGRNVYVRPDVASATVIAAPVLIDVDVAAEDLPSFHPRWRLAIDPEGLATLDSVRSARLRVEVEPRQSDDGLTVIARAVRLGSRRIPLPAWQRFRRPVPTDRLPAGLRLVGVRTAAGVVRLSAVLDEWAAPVTASTLADLAAALTAGVTDVELPVQADRPSR